MAALDSLNASFISQINVNGTVLVTGLLNPLGGPEPATLTQTLVSTIAAAAAGGANGAYFALLSIAASGNTSLDLRSFTDVAGRLTQLLARVKWFRIHLLGASQTAPDGTAGTACSSITIGNSGANDNGLFLVSATGTWNLNNASRLEWVDGSAAGVVTDATHKIVYILNNDATYAAKVLVTFGGGVT